jgi:hypothetical protein
VHQTPGIPCVLSESRASFYQHLGRDRAAGRICCVGLRIGSAHHLHVELMRQQGSPFRPTFFCFVVSVSAVRATRNLSCPPTFCCGMRNLRTVLVVIPSLLAAGLVWARDDGRYANSPLKSWFDSLRSGRGLCCSNADGVAVADPDWDSKDGHFRVRLDGQWIDVPDDAVVKEPNRAGRTMVWPNKSPVGTSIRCFLPGSMS